MGRGRGDGGERWRVKTKRDRNSSSVCVRLTRAAGHLIDAINVKSGEFRENRMEGVSDGQGGRHGGDSD